MMGLDPAKTIYDLVMTSGDLDPDKLAGSVNVHPSGVHVIPAPVRPEDAELVQEDRVAHLLEVAKQAYDVIVVDTPAQFHATTLATLDRTDRLALLGEPRHPDGQEHQAHAADARHAPLPDRAHRLRDEPAAAARRAEAVRGREGARSQGRSARCRTTARFRSPSTAACRCRCRRRARPPRRRSRTSRTRCCPCPPSARARQGREGQGPQGRARGGRGAGSARDRRRQAEAPEHPHEAPEGGVGDEPPAATAVERPGGDRGDNLPGPGVDHRRRAGEGHRSTRSASSRAASTTTSSPASVRGCSPRAEAEGIERARRARARGRRGGDRARQDAR